MTEQELDALLMQPLPERDAGEFSVAVMEAIARSEARPSRILAWIMLGLLAVAVAAACIFGAMLAGRGGAATQSLLIPVLTLLTLLLSFAALQSARE